jgi:hypothetical protein
MNTSYMKIRLITILLILALISGCSGAASPTPTATLVPPTPTPDLTVLFIGDYVIFWNDLPQNLPKLAGAADPPLMVEVGTPAYRVGGVRLETQWDTLEVHDLIAEGYDVIILQESRSGCIDMPEVFHEYARKFYQEAEDSGSELVLFMPYPEKANWDMLEAIEQSHAEIASELGIKVAPVALAWQRALEEYPDYELYDEDGENPNAYGDYLGLCVVYATITGNSPVGISYHGILPDDKAANLQQIAWDAVQEYQQ